MTRSETAQARALAQRLAEAEAIIEALLSNQVDAVVEPKTQSPILLVRAQEALRLSQKRLRDIIDGLGPSIFVALLTPEGIVIEINQSPLTAAGLMPADVLGKAFDQTPWWTWSEESQQQLREAILHAADGVASRYDARVRGLGDDLIDIDFSIQPLRDESGKVAFLIPSGSVITERKEMEVALRDSDKEQRRIAAQLTQEKARLVDAQSVAKMGSWETDITTGVVTWSDETHRIFETTADTFYPTHQGFMEMVHPEDRAAVDDAFVQSGSKTGIQAIEHRIVMRDGRIKFVEERWRILQRDRGPAQRAIGTCQDISERKIAENALRESNDKFLELAENISDVFWIRSPDMQKVLYISPAFEKIWGIPNETLHEDPGSWLNFVVPSDRERVAAAFAGLMKSDSGIDVEYAIVRADGGLRTIRSRGFQVRDEQQRLVRLIGIVTDVTEHRLIADALKHSMEEFRALAESMPQMVWITRPDGWNIYCNQMWVEYTGLTLEQTSGYGWDTPFHPEDKTRAGQAWKEAMENSAAYSHECRVRRTDGVYRWWLIRGVPVKDSHGTVLKWFGTCTDVDDLKLAELEVTRTNRALTMMSGCNEALVRAETETELLQEVCRIAVEDGGYRMAWVGYAQNDEAHSIMPMAHAGFEEGYLSAISCSWNENDPLGQGPAGQVIRTGRAIVSEDSAENSTQTAWDQSAQQRGYRGVIRLPLRDATHTFGLLGLYSAETNQPTADEVKLLQEMADNAAFGIGSLRVESERRRMQSAVIEQAALLDIAHEAIQVKDLDGNIIYWNKGAERLYGWTAAEIRGSIPIAARFKDPSAFKVARAGVLAVGTWEGEMIRCTKDGRAITVEERWTLVTDTEGKPKSILAMSTDITEKKKLESQLMVSDRMASVGTLAAGVAHEINNPLAAVMANLDYVVETLTKASGGSEGGMGRSGRIDAGVLEEIKGPLSDAREAAQRVRAIVRDLKIFSRTPSEDAPGPVDVKAVMESSLGMAWNEIRHRARLVKEYGDVPPVEANEGRLGQVFLNLLVNAAQAVPEGRAEHNLIRVSTTLDGERVITAVHDTGPGIPPQIMNRIFDAFFTTKAVGVGTGLGLAICQRIVTDMGGELTVESEVGRGTTFFVALPIARSTESRAAKPVESVAPAGRRGRILVVDDELMLVTIVKRILSREHEVVSTMVAKEALGLCLKGEKFDLILCDLMMPDMTGMDLHAELSRLVPEMANRMIFLTGGAFTAKARAFLADPPKEHIEKPFDAGNLRAIVQRYLRSES